MRSDFRKNLANIIPWSPAPQRSDSGESDQKSHCALLLRNPYGHCALRMDEVWNLVGSRMKNTGVVFPTRCLTL